MTEAIAIAIAKTSKKILKGSTLGTVNVRTPPPLVLFQHFEVSQREDATSSRWVLSP
jgi:hypothetical protein